MKRTAGIAPLRRPTRAVVKLRPPWLVRHRTDVCLALVLAALVGFWWGR